MRPCFFSLGNFGERVFGSNNVPTDKSKYFVCYELCGVSFAEVTERSRNNKPVLARYNFAQRSTAI